jgi:hypothetical protein
MKMEFASAILKRKNRLSANTYKLPGKRRRLLNLMEANRMDKIERAELLTFLLGYVSAEWLSPEQAYEVGKLYGCVP